MEFFDDIIIPYEYLQQPSKLYPSTLLDLVQCSQYLSKLQCMQSRNFISHLHMLLPPSPTLRTFPDTLQSSCNLFHNKFLQTFSHYKLNKLFYTHYLSNVSCNLFRFDDDHMRLKEHFHWLVPQSLVSQVVG